jgi:hypothetical protein
MGWLYSTGYKQRQKPDMLGPWHTVAFVLQLCNTVTITVLLATDTGTNNWEHRWSSISGYRSVSWPMLWLLPVFCLLSTITHLWGALWWWLRSCKRYHAMGEELSVVHWYEYSISAGLMTWLLAVMSGQRDLGVLVSLLFLNALLQSYGLQLDRDWANYKQNTGSLLAQSWWLFVSMWLIIFSAFYSSLDQAEQTVPTIVYVIVWWLFSLYCLFGVLPFARWLGFLNDAVVYQKCFITLSTVAKTSLVWMVWFGAVREGVRN